MLTANRNRNFSRTENGAYGITRDRPAFGSHQSVADSDKIHEHKSLIQRMDHLAISNNKDQLLSPSSFTSMVLFDHYFCISYLLGSYFMLVRMTLIAAWLWIKPGKYHGYWW